MALLLTAVRCLNDKTGTSLRQCLAYFDEAADRLPGASCKAEPIDDPTGQAGPNQRNKIGRQADGTARSACKSTPGAGGFYHIGTGAQPETPAGQPCSQVRDDKPVRTQNEAQHPRPLAMLTRDDAAAQRTALLLFRG